MTGAISPPPSETVRWPLPSASRVVFPYRARGTKVTAPFIHEKALVEPGATIGRGTRVWAFCHVLPGAVIGDDCNLCDQTFFENDVVIGNRVTVKCGVHVWDGVRLEDDVFVGPSVVFTNDPFPRSRHHLTEYPRTTVRRGASLGANCTLLPGITIGQYAMVGAGAMVTHDVPPYAIVAGNPAAIRGYVTGRKAGAEPPPPTAAGTAGAIAGGARLIELPKVRDLRGSLTFGEVGKHLPFVPHRVFAVFGVPNREVRGEHAHRRCHQLLICLGGSVSVMVDDGVNRSTFVLDRPTLAAHLPPMIWASQYHYSADATLLVLASDPYDAEDYIRDYDTFVREARGGA